MKKLLLLLLTLCLFACKDGETENTAAEAPIDPIEQKKSDSISNINLKIQKRTDSLANVKKLKSDVLNRIDILKEDRTKYHENVGQAVLAIDLYERNQRVISEALAISNDTLQKDGKKLETTLKNLQNKEYPLLRLVYANEIGNKLWEHDIELKVSGNRSQNITFIGGLYAANRNIKESMEASRSVLEKFRFKKVTFQWYDGADGTYYTLDTPKDSELSNY